jgi:transcriptional regulator with XRE-family HTH domain/SAM-dependent methyltransferase
VNLEEIGQKIKAMRVDRGFSLASLAHRSGISKSALFGIEEGRVNPTVNSLWSVATALGLPFGELVQEDSELHENNLTVKLIEKNKQFEVYKMSISDYFSKITAPHAFGTTEEVFVLSGEIRTGELTQPITLRAGEKGHFKADTPHMYQALSMHTVVIVTISYSGNEEKYFYEDRFVDTLDDEGIEALLGELENGIEMLRIIPSQKQVHLETYHRNMIFVEHANGTLYLSLRNHGVMANLRKILTTLGAVDSLEMIQKIYRNQPVTVDVLAEKMLYSEIALLRGEVQVYPEVLLDFSHEHYTKQDQTSFERRISVGLYSVFEYFHPGYIAQGLIVASFLTSVRDQFNPKRLHILDVGSGPGQHIRLINAFTYDLDFACIEPSKQAGEYLQKIDNVSEVMLKEFDKIVSLPQQQIILSVGSSHHLKLKQFLERSYELLDDGGYLIICDEFIAPFMRREERMKNLILHHTAYMMEVMVPIAEHERLSSQEHDIYQLMRQAIPRARYLALHGETDEASSVLYNALNALRALKKVTEIVEASIVYYIFMILELEALVAGLDYEEERKTSAKNLIILAEDAGYTLRHNSCFHPTSPESGTYFLAFQK